MVMGVMNPKELLGPGGPKGWPLEVVKGDPNYPKNPLLFIIECQRVPKVLHGQRFPMPHYHSLGISYSFSFAVRGQQPHRG